MSEHDQAPKEGPDDLQPLGTSGHVIQKKQRRMGLLIAVAVAVVVALMGTTAVVLVLNHRSDVAAQERRAKETREAEELQAEAERKAEEERRAEATALAEATELYDTCVAQLNPMMSALNDIDARLDVGLSQSELADMLGDASIAYNRIDVDALGQGNCLAAAAKLEGSFNKYNLTINPWEECIFDSYCDVDNDVLPGMQLKWFRASVLLEDAEEILETLDPDSATYDADSASAVIG